MSKVISSTGKTSIGRRVNNQDSFLVFHNKHDFLITAIADGMGGHKGGEVASQFTLKYIKDFLNEINFSKMPAEEIQYHMANALRKLQKKFKDLVKVKEELIDMGTTLNLNIYIEDIVYSLNIGDTRTSQYSKKEITKITEDHNLATLAKRDSKFAKFKNYSNLLTSSLGPNKETKVDMFITELNKKGYIIQTSDGVHNYVSDNELIKILNNTRFDNDEKGNKILETAFENGSNDNMTVLLVEYDK